MQTPERGWLKPAKKDGSQVSKALDELDSVRDKRGSPENRAAATIFGRWLWHLPVVTKGDINLLVWVMTPP